MREEKSSLKSGRQFLGLNLSTVADTFIKRRQQTSDKISTEKSAENVACCRKMFVLHRAFNVPSFLLVELSAVVSHSKENLSTSFCQRISSSVRSHNLETKF